MLHFLPPFLVALIAVTLLVVNILFWVPILLVFALIRLVLPFKATRLVIDPIALVIAESWISCNSGWMRLTQKLQWDVQGIEGLDPKSWYLVNSNHQSWVDIFVLQHLLNRKIPLLKFFIKQELIWVPIMGLAWWALDSLSCAATARNTCASTRKCVKKTAKPRARPARNLHSYPPA